MPVSAKRHPSLSAQPARPRLRILAGPNGSGKSTIKSELKPEWIGAFVNADEMERELNATDGALSLGDLGVSGDAGTVRESVLRSLATSGLQKKLDLPTLRKNMTLDEGMTPGCLVPVTPIWLRHSPKPYGSNSLRQDGLLPSKR